MKKAKDESKKHENAESMKSEGKETMMEKKGYKETKSGKMVKAAEGDMMGGLSGKKSKLDANKDGKISGEDFKMLRTKKMIYGGVASPVVDGTQAYSSFAQQAPVMEAPAMDAGMSDPMSGYKDGGSVNIGKGKDYIKDLL